MLDHEKYLTQIRDIHSKKELLDQFHELDRLVIEDLLSILTNPKANDCTFCMRLAEAVLAKAEKLGYTLTEANV